MAMAMTGMADMAGMATIILNQEQRLLVPLTMLKSVSAALAALPALIRNIDKCNKGEKEKAHQGNMNQSELLLDRSLRTFEITQLFKLKFMLCTADSTCLQTDLLRPD